MPVADVSAVVLTRGDRRSALLDALRSVADQRDVHTERIVVWNGAEAFDLPDGLVDHNLELASNIGIPEGRNVGAATASAPLLLFLDDDARLVDEISLATIVDLFADDRRLGVLSMRLVDEAGDTTSRHVPRIGRGAAERSGEVTSFLGGACCVRAAAFTAIGEYPGAYFYAMEETDLAWRMIDNGWTVRYAPEHQVFHPHTEPSRHPEAAWRTARNRAWLAHRLLPWPLVPVYLGSWLMITVARQVRGRASLRAFVSGVRDGWRTRMGPRRPIRWSTVWRLTRLGRPPIV